MKFITMKDASNLTVDAAEDKICGIREAAGDQFHVQVQGFKNPVIIDRKERDRLVGAKAPAKKKAAAKK